jgi:hypothetical protein
VKRALLALTLTVGTAALLAGCAGDTGVNNAQIAVQLTDAPTDMFDSAIVWVSSVYLIGGTDPSGPKYTVSSTPQQYDLLTLTGGVTATLGTASVPAGDYTQLRLVVDSAQVFLKTGLTFRDGSTSKVLQTPSARQSGIKVNFSGPVHVESGVTVLVVDFDVSRNFVITGGPNLIGVLFTPVLHATVRDVAGSIAGTVSPANAKAQLYAIMNGDTVTSAMADTLTGAYKLWYLPPGSYTVAATASGYQDATASTSVAEAQNVTGVDFTLTP